MKSNKIKEINCATLLATFLISFTTGVTANPTGEQVVVGQAGFSRSGSQLNINQLSDKVIINWQDFSIANGELTKFVQPNNTSAALNRVVTGNLSSLLGDLQANGQVYLINPNGIIVGADANINTQSFIASTLDVNNDQFMQGGELSFVGDSEQTIENLGTIEATGGDVFLIAKRVENSGTINADGQVGLAGANDVLLKASGDDRLTVRITDKDGSVDQSGLIEAAKIELRAANNNPYALAINHDGISRATGAVNQNGRVLLAGGDQGEVHISGTLDASGKDSGETGGQVIVLGEKVGLFDEAKLDVSGDAGGGEVLLGGEQQGSVALEGEANTDVLYIDDDAEINADAITEGDGGRIITWANHTNRAFGDITAHGGAASGDGGFVEISGGHYFEIGSPPDVAAVNGVAGDWLIDPTGNDLNIVAGGGNTNINAANPFATTSDAASLGWNLISAALIAGTSVTVTTTNSGTNSQNGDINVNTDLDYNGIGTGKNLTLNAIGDIVFNNRIFDSSGTDDILNLNLFAGGGITLDADGSVVSGTFNATTFNGVGGFFEIEAGTTFTVKGSGSTLESTITAYDYDIAGTLNYDDTDTLNLVQRSSSPRFGIGTTTCQSTFCETNIDSAELNRIVVPNGTLNFSASSKLFVKDVAAANTDQINSVNLTSVGGDIEFEAGTGSNFTQLALDLTNSFDVLVKSDINTTSSFSSIQSVNFTVDPLKTINTNNNTLTVASGAVNATGALNAGAGSIDITASSGSITGTGVMTGGNIDLTASAPNASIGSIGSVIETNASGIVTATATNGNGGIFLQNQGNLVLDNFNTGTGNLVLTAADGTITSGAAAYNFSGTNLTLTTTEDGGNTNPDDRNIIIGSGGFNAPGASVTFNSADNVELNGDLQMDFANSLIKGDTLIANAVNGIGSAGAALRTELANAALSNTGSGGIYVINTGDVTVAASSNNGDVSIETTQGRSGIPGGFGTETPGANGGNITVGSVDTLSGITTTGAGDVSLRTGRGGIGAGGGNGGALTLDAALNVSGAATLTSGDGGLSTFKSDSTGPGPAVPAAIVGIVGGDGGALTLNAALNASGAATLTSGDGGTGGTPVPAIHVTTKDGAAAGSGGMGGALTLNAALNAPGVVTLTSGTGGTGGTGGFGGMGGALTLNAALNTPDGATLTSGTGGTGGDGGTSGIGSDGGGGHGGSGGALTLNAALNASGAATLTSGSGGFGGLGFIDGTVGAASNITGGQIEVSSSADNVTVNGVIAPDAGSSVSLSAFNTLTLNPLQDINLTGAGNLSLQGFGFSSANNYSTVDGDISINSGDGALDLTGTVTASNGDVNLSSGGNLTASQIITGDNIGLIASGLNSAIGSSGAGAIQTNASGIVTATASNGNGGIFLSKQGDFDISNLVLNTGTGVAELTAIEGNLVSSAAVFNFVGSNLTLITTEDVNNGNVGDRNIQIGSGGINAANSNLVFSSADDVIVDGVINSATFTATSGDGRAGAVSGGSGERGHHGGSGGNITINATLHSASDITLQSGSGGDGENGGIGLSNGFGVGSYGVGTSGGTGGDGGAGGSIAINAALTSTAAMHLTAGSGGDGENGGRGIGEGDSSSGSYGFGTSGGTGGRGGAGGSITVNAALTSMGAMHLTAGIGGGSGDGGLGETHGFASSPTGSYGFGNSGGTGGLGGAGGSIIVNAALTSTGAMHLTAGGGGGGGADAGGFAGNGLVGLAGSDGSISGNQINASATNGDITVTGQINPDAGSSVSLLAGTSAGQLLTFTTPQDFNLTGTGSLNLQGFGFGSAKNFSTVDGDIFVNSGDGDLILGSGFSAASSGSGNIILAASGDFHNDSGSNAPFSVNTGRYLVYSTRPDNNRDDIGTDTNAIAHDFVEYGTVFDANNHIPMSLPAGNGFIYSAQPVLTGITVTVNNQTIDYGQSISTTDFTLVGGTPGSYEVGGFAINAADFELTAPGSIAAGDITLALDSSVGLSTAGFAEAGSYTSGIEAVFASGTSSGLSLDGVGDLTVNSIDVNVTLGADNKIYDATTDAVLSIVGDDRVVGDILTVDLGTSAFADKNAGVGKAITIAGTSLTGADAGNYNLVVSNAGSLTADISAADLIINGAVAQDKVYDGVVAATVTGSGITALLTDDVNLSLDSAAFADKNVDTNKVVATSYSISGTDASNYNLIQPTGLMADITLRTLNAAFTANDKIYDGLTTTTGSVADDRVTGDVLTINNGGINFTDKNVGVAKNVTASGLSLSGTGASNYVLAGTTANDTADITVRTITASLVANDKVYDALTTATGLLNDDRVSGDVLSVDNTGIDFDNKNIGTAKTVTASSLSLSGTDAGNYILAATSTIDTANITAADLIISGALTQDKVYDGTTTAFLTGASISPLAGDSLLLSGFIDGIFADKNVGTGKSITSNFLISGDDAGNYNLIQPTGLTADITLKTLNISLFPFDKVYDGSTLTTGLFASEVIAGDDLVFNNTDMNFSDKNVGVDKTVTMEGLFLSGADANNYVLASTTATGTADVTAKTLTVGLIAEDKVYDALTTASGLLNDDRIAGDVLTINNTGINFSDENVGVAKTVTAAGLSLTGNDGGNYLLASNSVIDMADITSVSLLVTANDFSREFDGTPFSGGNGVVFDGFIDGEGESILSGALSFSGSSQGAIDPGEFVLTPQGLSSGNYDIAFIDGILTIDPLVNNGGNSGSGGNGSNPIVDEFETFQSASQSVVNNNGNNGQGNSSSNNQGNNGNQGNTGNGGGGSQNNGGTSFFSVNNNNGSSGGGNSSGPWLSRASSFDDEGDEE